MLFEEMGGDPTQISYATKQVEGLCSRVSEYHPLPVDMWSTESDLSSSSTGSGRRSTTPILSLECPLPDQVISSIKFASFGTPRGACGSFSHSKCSSRRALSIVEKVHTCSLF